MPLFETKRPFSVPTPKELAAMLDAIEAERRKRLQPRTLTQEDKAVDAGPEEAD